MATLSPLIRRNDRIVFVGDSITDAQMYSNYVETYLTLRFPEWGLRFFNAGWSGDTAPAVARRLQRDVIALEPTLAIICLGMNDGMYTPPTDQILRSYAEGMESIVAGLKRERIRILLLTPGAVDEDRSPLLKLAQYNARGLRRLADFTLRYARQQKVAAYDMQKLMLRVQTAAKADDPAFTMVPDSVHPDAAGHLVMAFGVLEALGVPRRKIITTISARTGRATTAEGLRATEISRSGDRLRCVLECKHRPFPLPDGTAKVLPYVPFQERFNSITLAIRGLPAGRYVMREGPNRSHRFDAEALSAGINLADLPGSSAMEASRQVANQIASKNTIYLGLWRGQALAMGIDAYDRAVHRKAIELGNRLAGLANQRVERQAMPRKPLEIFPAPTNGQSISNGDFLTRWDTTDPIDAEFTVDALGGEPTASGVDYAAANGIAWTPRQFDVASLSNCLGTLFPNRTQCVAYCRIRLHSPTAQNATLLIGSDDGFAAWLNGVGIAENLLVQRGVIADQDRLPITLRAGANVLLVKITQVVAGWGFCARFEGLTEPIVADWPASPSA